MKHIKRSLLRSGVSAFFAGLGVAIGSGQMAKAATFPGGFDAHITWDRNPEPNITGYYLHFGTESGIYPTSVDVGNGTDFILPGLDETSTYYIVMTARNTLGIESGYSEELVVSSGSASGGSPLKIGQLVRSSDGTLTFGLLGGDGSPLDVSVFASDNLSDWTLLETVSDVTGTLTIVDPLAAIRPRRYYRLNY